MEAILQALGMGEVAPAIIERIRHALAIWHSIESVVVLIGLAWVSHRIKAERAKFSAIVELLTDRVETFGQFAKAARDAAEQAPAVAAGDAAQTSNGVSNWDAVRAEWLEIRDRIELAIEGISHKSVRGKYSKINRYSYRDVIVTLGEDDVISRQVETALLNMNQRYLALRPRPANTTQADVEAFRQWVRQVNGAIPRLPQPKQPPTSSRPEPPSSQQSQ